jgi:hypothetical protein
MRITAPAAVMIGILIGLAAGPDGYTFLYAKGASCLTNDPVLHSTSREFPSCLFRFRLPPISKGKDAN